MHGIVFLLFFFLLAFIVLPLLLFLVFWGAGKLLGRFIPWAAKAGKILGLTFLFGLIACYAFGFAFGWRMVKIREVSLEFKDLPASFDGYRIAQLSDWHIGTYSKNHKTIEREIEKVLEAKPDLIVFTGDLINRTPDEAAPFIPLLSTLKAPDGVWSIMGNHDYCTYSLETSPEVLAGYVKELQETEKMMGWTMLLNSNTVIHNGVDSLALIGVENDGAPPFPQYGDLGKAQADLSGGIFKILLSHDPTHWRRSVLPKTGIQLMLAGHTHAMQFRLWNLSPSELMFKEWAGKYADGDRKLFVSTGSGGNIPFRFGAWPEVDLITLRRGK